MNIREVVTGFHGAVELDGLEDAWHWSPVRGIDFAGGLSADGLRLLQTSSRGSYRQDLALATLRFAREREEERRRCPPGIDISGPPRDSRHRTGHRSTRWPLRHRRCTASITSNCLS
ncbi:hypothetical protein [Streptomyces avicenniae]|uniref:hypothetical protein n=1 Tax=Streptomyces avicenniae TaxID=500153 RepID=UPI00069A1EAF|nr:hypothetical protein [Streptomyces avicenniae]